MPLTEQEKTFQNPTGYWDYDGAFTIELAKGAPVEKVLPASVRWDGSVAHIQSGRVKQSMGAIQCYGAPKFGDPFYFSYDNIVCIRKSDGSLLWRNYHAK